MKSNGKKIYRNDFDVAEVLLMGVLFVADTDCIAAPFEGGFLE